jgi:hypothetical protein
MSMIINDEWDGSSTDRFAAIGSLYEGLLTGASAAASLTTALLGAVVVYITAATAFVDQILRADVLAGALLPAPIWIAALMQSMVTAASMVRAVSIRAIEHRLLSVAGLGDAERRYFGTAATEAVMNVTISRLPHKIATLVAYGSAGILGVLFTTYVLVRTAQLDRLVASGGAALYALAFVAVCWSAVAGLRFYRECAAGLEPFRASESG